MQVLGRRQYTERCDNKDAFAAFTFFDTEHSTMTHRHHLATLVLAALLALVGCSTSKSADKNAQKAPADNAQVAQKQTEAQTTDNRAAEGPANDSEDRARAESKATDDSAQAGADTPLGLKNGARPFDGIITAGQPTREQFDKLDEAGVNTVINMRAADEPGTWDEEAKADMMGLGYVDIVVTGPEDLTRKKAKLLNAVLRKEQGDFLVHCGSSNRVGALFALRAYWLLDKSPEEALEIGRRAGLTGLEEAVRSKM